MQATVTVFLGETHVETFGSSPRHIQLDHPDGMTYDAALKAVRNLIEKMGGEIKSKYFERNEFNDPIFCYFVELPND